MASIHHIAAKSRPAPMPMMGFDLPEPRTKRWVPRRKAQVVAAVQGGVLTLDEACHRYAPDGRGVPVLAARDRQIRPRRIARDSRAGISRGSLGQGEIDRGHGVQRCGVEQGHGGIFRQDEQRQFGAAEDHALGAPRHKARDDVAVFAREDSRNLPRISSS